MTRMRSFLSASFSLSALEMVGVRGRARVRVSGFGFRVPGFGLRVSGFGLRASGLGLRVRVRV